MALEVAQQRSSMTLDAPGVADEEFQPLALRVGEASLVAP